MKSLNQDPIRWGLPTLPLTDDAEPEKLSFCEMPAVPEGFAMMSFPTGIPNSFSAIYMAAMQATLQAAMQKNEPLVRKIHIKAAASPKSWRN